MAKRIILVGPGGAGKDYIREKFTGRGFKYATSYTTRPPRTTEKDGVDYNFLSREKFLELIDEDYFYEYVEFNGWFYGTAHWQMNECDIFIMTPSGIALMRKKERINSFIIYLNPPIEEIIDRLKARTDADSALRRLQADNADFSDFTDYDIRIKNGDF